VGNGLSSSQILLQSMSAGITPDSNHLTMGVRLPATGRRHGYQRCRSMRRPRVRLGAPIAHRPDHVVAARPRPEPPSSIAPCIGERSLRLSLPIARPSPARGSAPD